MERENNIKKTIEDSSQIDGKAIHENDAKNKKSQKQSSIQSKQPQKENSTKVKQESMTFVEEEHTSENKDPKKNIKDEKETTCKQGDGVKSTSKVNANTDVKDEIEIPDAQEKQAILEDIKRRKLFFVSDMDEEAVYLHEMSLQGYHFVSRKGMQYTFRQGEVKNYFYHLGYNEKKERSNEQYVDNYVNAGWESIFHEKGEFDGIWNYFRIEMPDGEMEPNILSDRVSRLALYKRLLSSWRTLLAVDVICFIFILIFYIFLLNHPSRITGVFIPISSVVFFALIIIFIVYYRAYLKISKKQEELRNI